MIYAADSVASLKWEWHSGDGINCQPWDVSMLELVVAATGMELSNVVLDQVLNLGRAALEDYTQDFFKDCIQRGVARAKGEALKKPMAEAIGFFMQRFIRELQINDVPETSLEHHYKAAIKQFVRDEAVRPILGSAFEKDCNQIDYRQLEQIWTQQYQTAGWRFPADEFDWRRVAKEYVLEVKGIVKADAELRAILTTDLLEDIANNTAQLSPGFDVETYRESLQASYGYLKLYTLDSTDRTDNIKLWNMFVEQTVREALPPMRYDLPLDLKRQLQAQGQLDDLSAEALEHYRQEYFQQPARKVLETVAEVQRAVILGDPGAGKSTLLQYLALDWVEGKTETLPLLIELREYVLAQSANFLEFLHCGRGADWQFDQQHLHQHLLENPTLVMFDGLDEVFDRPTQSAVMDDIIRFAQQYPQAKVIVTSRIIGYNPERFQHAGFRQFTIQNLDETEVHEFIDRWYDLAMGSDADKVRLKQRLKDAISNSKAIANLADNPLLLTMMAILNRRQELPRDRADLYDQASRVLLYHWDVDHKRLQLRMDAIGRREKQEMLRLIAYEMQAGEDGLKGNLISADRLIRVLTDYLQNQGFSNPREKANRLIQQLRERNFILCYRGADTYGFMHRTFLEYFCAVEIVHRFEKQRSLSFEQLRDEVFGQHWQDETWQEVLRLICGMVDSCFAEEIIYFLLDRKIEGNKFMVQYADMERLEPQGIAQILLAIDCIYEMPNPTQSIRLSIINRLKIEIQNPSLPLSVSSSWKLVDSLVKLGKEEQGVLEWLISLTEKESIDTETCIFPLVARNYHEDLKVLEWLMKSVELHVNPVVRWKATEAIQYYEPLNSNIFQLLLKSAKCDQEGVVRWAAINVLGNLYPGEPKTLETLIDRILNDDFDMVRSNAIRTMIQHDLIQAHNLELLKKCIREDPDESVRCAAIEAIEKLCSLNTEIWDLLHYAAIHDPFERKGNWESNPRQFALKALLNICLEYPKTFDLLRDRAINDPDEQLREWAQQQLEKLEKTEGF